MKTIWIIAKIWTALSTAFLGWFLLAHIFGGENFLFNSKKEMITFLFFPVAVLLGLGLTFWNELTGSIICVAGMLCAAIFIPELLKNIYFLLITMPGIFMLIISFYKISVK